jgi:hypothetical protein
MSMKRLVVQFPHVKYPFYLIENLPSGQLPHVLWPCSVGPLSQKRREDQATKLIVEHQLGDELGGV